MRRLLAFAIVAAACGPEGAEFSPTAHCRTRCEIVFECLDLPTGPAERDRAEFAECLADCADGLARPCERDAAFECTSCYERHACDDVTAGSCEPFCLAACE